jgi:type II secretory pathway component GspD/PulD (secretin)
MRIIFRTLVMTVAATSLLQAQGGRGNPPPTRGDTGVRRGPDGPVLDFREQDISIVLSAIAEAGNIGLQISPLGTPAIRVTLRVAQQMTKETAAEMIKAIAERNGLLVTETPSLILVAAPPRVAAPPAQPQLSPAQQQQLALMNRTRIFNTVRLKHATASTVAPLLMNLLRGVGSTGAGVGRGNVALPGGIQLPGNVNNPNQGRGGNAGGGGGGGNQGRGGGGGNQVIIPGTNVPIQLGGRGGVNPAQLAQQILGGLGGGGATGNLAFSDINIVPDDGTNSLIVFATLEDFQAIQPIIQSIDLRPLQVLLEVTIAQVERSSDLNYGLSGVVSKTKPTGVGTQTRTDTNAILPGAASARDFITQIVGGKGAVNYAVAMNALQTRGDVRVLSLPIIVAQNNRQAVLNVGSRVPFVSVTQSSGIDPAGRVQTIQYQDVGTTLTVTPTINSDGYVNLTVTQTANNATPSLQFDAPVISTREAQTQIFIRNGQTAVFGGLADNTSSKNTSGIPFLSRIPIIGGLLFGNTQRNNSTTELFLFLTPHIVSSDEDIDRLRESIRSGSEMLKDVPLHRVNPGGDTIRIGVPPDSVKPPPRRPPPDTLSVPASQRVPREERSPVVPWAPNRERLF